MVYLVIVTIIPASATILYDIYTGSRVVTSYQAIILPLRYFFEPFIGLTFVFGFEHNPLDVLTLLIVFYIVLRVALLIVNRVILARSEKKEVFTLYVTNVLNFFGKYGLLTVLGIGLTILFGFILFGFLWVANAFDFFLHLGAYTGLALLVGKTIHVLVVYYHPRLTLKKKVHKKTLWKVLSRIKKEALYFGVAFLLLFCMNNWFLGIPFPGHYIQANLAPDEILIDMHVHTTMSDGMLTPEARVLWYMSQGIQAATILDHHHPYGALAAKAFVERWNLPFTVWIGQEFTADPENVHLNIYGIDVPLTPEGYTHGPAPNVMNVSEAIIYTKANGGYVIVSHYRRNSTARYTYEDLRDWGVDGFAIGNGGDEVNGFNEIRAFCIANNLIMLSTTDSHMNYELNAFTKIKLNDPDPNNRSLDQIFESLRTNTPECIIIPKYPYYRKYDSDDPFARLYALNDYMIDMDVLQLLSWILWSAGGLCLLVLAIYKVKKMDKAKLKSKWTEVTK